jgi:flagellar M-ring protein FliF
VQVMSVWQALDPRKRIIVLLATLAMFAAVYALTAVATRPSLALLYAGIEGSRSGEVLAALDQRGVTYEVRGQAIYVDSTRRDELRMELAAQGLPQNSGSGYELLDGLSGFGTTSQMFDAAYWRAKEGELARTIAAMPNMRSVRVHISNTEPQGFRQTGSPKASVAVVTRDGALSPDHARALKFLVSAAVAGMKPEDVAVIDGDGNLILADDDTGAKAGSDRAAALRENVTRLLEARVGYGKAVVEVAVETVTESEAISERKIDPQGRVAISSENEEKSSSAQNQGDPSVSVASNLPTGAAAGGGKSSQSNDSSTRERVNYEVSETKRELVKNPGAIRRITVAVLVDGVTQTAADGTTLTAPRPDDELAALKDLVAAAVGFDEARGDVITIRSFAFEPASAAGSEASGGGFATFAIDVMTLVQLAVLALVALVLGLFVVRPVLTSRATPVAASLPAPQPAAGPVLTGVIEDDGAFPERPILARGARRGAAAEAGEAGPPEIDDPVARLRRLISERQEESVEILKSWMDDPQAEKA